MTAQSDHFARSSAVSSPVTADAEGVALSSSVQGGTRRTQRNSEHPPSRWLTELLDRRLTELHALKGADALSFAEIAWQLNDEFSMHMSRNAVIGRVHRMQLPGRVTFKRHGRPVKITKKPKIKFVKTIKPKPAAPAQPRNLPLIQLQHHDCRFATVGDEAPYLFCAQATVENSSWCAVHFKAVHNDVRLL
jgi:hypothetical protein